MSKALHDVHHVVRQEEGFQINSSVNVEISVQSIFSHILCRALDARKTYVSEQLNRYRTSGKI